MKSKDERRWMVKAEGITPEGRWEKMKWCKFARNSNLYIKEGLK